MISFRKRNYAFFCLLAIFLLSESSAQSENGGGALSWNFFDITSASMLAIEGTSNVKDFTCECRKDFPEKPMRIQMSEDGRAIKFSNTYIKVPTTSLDCGGRGINRDMHKTLKAEDFPYIRIELKEAQVASEESGLYQLGKWTDLSAMAEITLAGVKKRLPMEVTAQRISSNLFQFKSSEHLTMTAFGIDPPRPLLGLIQVHDDIQINLDLYIQLEP